MGRVATMSEAGPASREASEALRREVAALHSAAWGWALTCCKRDHDHASEVLQDSYAKVLSGKAQFSHRSSFKTWLFGVIRWTAREHARRGLLRRLGLAHYRQFQADPPASSDSLLLRERVDALTRALATLSTRQREVLHLVFYEGLTVNEAAIAMSVSVGSARRHYHRGKRNLLERLEGEGVSRD